MKKKILAVLLALTVLISALCLLCGFSVGIPQKKFYINSAAVDAMKRITTVYKDEGGYYVMGYQYITINRTSPPHKNSSCSDIDAVICMTRQLENLIDKHITDVNKARVTAFNIEAGYIRSINKKYESLGVTSAWEHIAGDWDGSIIKYTGFSGGDEISVRDFFASFVSSQDYNTGIDEFIGSPISSYFLARNVDASDPFDDPFDNPKGPKYGIDLIHMFASMDGIYEQTGKSLICKEIIGYSFSKDLASWLGDLQTYAEEVEPVLKKGAILKDYNLSDGFIDFNKYNSENFVGTKFSAEDLYADIDAMNIIKIFFDGTTNLLSDAILGYYTVVQPNKALLGNRFDLFIDSCTMDLDGGAGYATLKDRFLNEICHPMNLEYVNGTYIDKQYYKNSDKRISLMGNASGNFEARKYATKLFSDYVILNSHRFN